MTAAVEPQAQETPAQQTWWRIEAHRTRVVGWADSDHIDAQLLALQAAMPGWRITATPHQYPPHTTPDEDGDYE